MDVDDPEEAEETILEYAEYHNLATNCSAEEYLDAELSTLQESPEPLSLDDSNLYQLPYTAPKVSELRLTLDKDAALILRSVNQHRDEPDPWNEIARHCKTTHRNGKKIDLPLLKTDPDADLTKFKARVRVQLKPEDEFLPSEPLDDEKDEGLGWTSQMNNLAANKMAELDHTKLTISKVDIAFIMEALREDYESKDNEELLESQHTYRRVRLPLHPAAGEQFANMCQKTALDRITPPLSPVFFSDFEPFVPSSTVFALPLLSDPASLSGADQKAVEQKISNNDKPALEDEPVHGSPEYKDTRLPDVHNNNHQPYGEFPKLESLLSDERFPTIERHRKEDLQIDNGLTPPMPISSHPKTVTFSDHVETMLLDEEYSEEESLRADSRNAGIMAWDSEVKGAFKAATEKINHKLEREQLQEAATTKKVDVPTLDFSSSHPPWKELKSLRSAKKILEYQDNLICNALEDDAIPSKLPGLHKLKESLRWAPFPTNLAKVALAEELQSGEDIEGFLTVHRKITTSGDIAFSRDFLKCLEALDDDDEEELEPADFVDSKQAEEDLDSVLRRKKRQLDHDVGDDGHQAKQPKLAIHAHEQDNSRKRPAGDKNYDIFGNLDFYSAGNALDNFMEARGKKKPKPTGSDYFSTSKRTPTPKQHLLPVAPTAPSASRPTSAPLPLPTFNPPDNSTPFIVSTTLMQIRPIIKAITGLYPSAHLIERDFSKHDESSWMKGTVKRSPVVSPLASEADLIVSPSISVVMTTLAKIKQRPLPGQKTRVKILERIEGVAQRYARVIVFVSEGSADDSTRSLNGQDAMAYAEFVGFCSTQECAVTPIYVPGGSQALGTWIASAMVQHGIHDGSQASLMEDETIWELFLRRCGMNAYVAQSVVAAMRAPEGVNSSSPNKASMFGLPGFVQMELAERVRQFETLFGGTRVLERVSAAIDTPWRPPTPVMVPGFAPPPPTYGHGTRDPRLM